MCIESDPFGGRVSRGGRVHTGTSKPTSERASRPPHTASGENGATRYEVVRSNDPQFPSGCWSETTTATELFDGNLPDPGEAFHFMVRPLTPHPGGWGPGPDGAVRDAVCP